MLLRANDLSFGNPSETHKNLIVKKTLLTSLYADFENKLPPSNESETTGKELETLIQFTKDIQLEDNAQYLNDYQTLNTHPVAVIVQEFKEYFDEGELEKIVNQVFDMVAPLTYKLKYKHNRPRPFQLANLYKLKLFPVTSKGMESPSYPSNSIVSSSLALMIIGNKNPDIWEKVKNMQKQIVFSKLYLGLHYQSDVDLSTQIVETIMKNKEFAKTFGI